MVVKDRDGCETLQSYGKTIRSNSDGDPALSSRFRRRALEVNPGHRHSRVNSSITFRIRGLRRSLTLSAGSSTVVGGGQTFKLSSPVQLVSGRLLVRPDLPERLR